jgi:hypothetical protein
MRFRFPPAPPALVLPALLALLPACGAEVGDSCSTNVDCSSLGDRICDTAQYGGYCTVEGCDLTSCPSEAACISFFPTAFLSVPCDPATEDSQDPSVKPTQDCTSEEFCLSSGFCVQRTLERRFCMKSCETDGDCRDGYECRQTGTRGAEAVPDPAKPGEQRRFCAQRL